MKRTLYFLLLLSSFSIYSGANTVDSIPNAGFERWFYSTWYPFPQEWQTNNTQILPLTVVPDTDSYSGNFAMQLINSGALQAEAWTGFNIQEHPLALMGFVKNWIPNNDSAIVTVTLYQNGLVVDSGKMMFYGGINPYYYSFAIPISQNNSLADSCEIRMIGGGLYLATISFDELSFTSASGISNKELNESLQIFPNPGSSTVYITSLDFSLNQADIEICDMAGRIIARNKGIKMVSTNCFFPETDKKVKIELGSIPKGVYYIVISSTKGNYSRLLIRQ